MIILDLFDRCKSALARTEVVASELKSGDLAIQAM
jgi:hypothetical protein